MSMDNLEHTQVYYIIHKCFIIRHNTSMTIILLPIKFSVLT